MARLRNSAVRGGGRFVNDDKCSGVGEFDFGWFDWVGAYFPHFVPPVAYVGRAGKKGVRVPSSFSAVFIGARRASLVWST